MSGSIAAAASVVILNSQPKEIGQTSVLILLFVLLIAIAVVIYLMISEKEY